MKLGRKVQLRPMLCPHCGHMIDGANGVGHSRRPTPGDKGVCLNCAGLLEYGPDLIAVAASPDKLAELEREDPDAYRTLRATQARALLLVGSRGPGAGPAGGAAGRA